MSTKPTFNEALRFWLKLGFISFGGPGGQIAILHEFLVEKKKWISESKFLHALNYCMLLPGPEAQQLATYMGWMLHGTKGGIAAGLLFILPSVFILFGLSTIYIHYGNLPFVFAMFDGLKPAVIAIILLALIKMSKKSLKSPLHYFIAIAAFVCIYFFQLPFPMIILGAIVLALIVRKGMPGLSMNAVNSNSPAENNESAYYINRHTLLPDTGFRPATFGKKIFFFLALWCLPLFTFYLFSSDFPFWKQLSLFFTQAAFVTFGGAYAVLPYVAQVSVEKFHWLSGLQMLDGLALGETTPGPLIMVLAFVGFMAGYNQFGSSILMGGIGLVTTTWYTFLPSFLFIFLGAPLIERTSENKSIKAMLEIVTAAVVGVILNLTIYLAKAVLLTATSDSFSINFPSLLWVLISFIALYRYSINLITWIGISALFGLIVFGFAG